MGLSERLKVPPVAGGVLDQPIWVLRALHILEFASGEQLPSEPPRVEFADLQQLMDVPALVLG